MIWELRLLGLPIVSIRVAEFNADGPTDLPRYDLTGGEFERDTEPLRANREEPYYEEDRRVGFSA